MKTLAFITVSIWFVAVAGCESRQAIPSANADSIAAVEVDPLANAFETEVIGNRGINSLDDPDTSERRWVCVIPTRPLTREETQQALKSVYESWRADIEKANPESDHKTINLFFWDREKWEAVPRDLNRWRGQVRSYELTPGPTIADWPAFQEWPENDPLAN